MHSTAFIAWIAFTQQVISFNNSRFFDVRALLSNKNEHKLRSLNFHVGS